MRERFHFDIYTALMIGLVPMLLLTARGIEYWHDGRLYQRQCQMAADWLAESADIAPQFAFAGTMDRTMFWSQELEDISSPASARKLRSGVLQSAKYYQTYYANNPTDKPGILNPTDGMFSREIKEGRKSLVDHCPETAAMLPTAFPMIFQKEDP